jgi:hypothetical protein
MSARMCMTVLLRLEKSTRLAVTHYLRTVQNRIGSVPTLR